MKRVHIGLVSTLLISAKRISKIGCSTEVEPISKRVVCRIAVGGAVLVLLYGAYRSLSANSRMLVACQGQDLGLTSQMIDTLPRVPGKSVDVVF